MLALLPGGVVAGLVVQRPGRGELARERAWTAWLCVVVPVLLFLTFATLEIALVPTPDAFHFVIPAQVYDALPALTRPLGAGSTIPAVLA